MGAILLQSRATRSRIKERNRRERRKRFVSAEIFDGTYTPSLCLPKTPEALAKENFYVRSEPALWLCLIARCTLQQTAGRPASPCEIPEK